MAITIGGINITDFDIKRNREGAIEVTGKYELTSSTGIVLAKQGFNGYNDVKLVQSRETAEIVQKLLGSAKTDLNNILGIE